MNKKTYYCTYNDYSAVFNTETRCFSVLNNKEILAENIYINGLFLNGKKEIDASEFYDVKAEQGQGLDYNFMKVYFKSKQKGDVLMEINVSAKGIVLSFTGLDFYTIGMTGFLSNGKSDDCFAVSLGGPTEDMRAAIGKAASVIDNAVYNKSDDTAVCIENCHHLRLKYDYDKEMYGFKVNVTNRGYI